MAKCPFTKEECIEDECAMWILHDTKDALHHGCGLVHKPHYEQVRQAAMIADAILRRS